MNEYRVPEINVQNGKLVLQIMNQWNAYTITQILGVLKALSFLFEYIGEMAKVWKLLQHHHIIYYSNKIGNI